MGLFNVSNQQLARITSKIVYENIYQDVLHKDGFGITDRFVRPEQTAAGLIDIYVPIPLSGRFRKRGAASNGAWANQKNLPDATTGQRNHVLSKRFTIDTLQRYDLNIAVSEDEIEGTGLASLDKGFEQIAKEQIAQDIAINVNGYTFAMQIYQFFMDSFSATPTAAEVADAIETFVKPTTASTTNADAIAAFKLANAKVSKGNSALYAGYYPAQERQGFIWDTSYLVYLSLPAVGHASDIATRMVAGGGFNAFTNSKKTVADYEKGLVGWLDGMPLYQVLQQVHDATWAYLGLDPTVTADQSVITLLEQMCAFICPSNATIRGMRPNSFKTVDDPDAQGVIIQPKVNMGVRCLSGKSLKAVFSGGGFTDAASTLASIAVIRNGIAGKLLLPQVIDESDLVIPGSGVLSAEMQQKVDSISSKQASEIAKLKAEQNKIKDAKDEEIARLKAELDQYKKSAATTQDEQIHDASEESVVNNSNGTFKPTNNGKKK